MCKEEKLVIFLSKKYMDYYFDYDEFLHLIEIEKPKCNVINVLWFVEVDDLDDVCEISLLYKTNNSDMLNIEEDAQKFYRGV